MLNLGSPSSGPSVGSSSALDLLNPSLGNQGTSFIDGSDPDYLRQRKALMAASVRYPWLANIASGNNMQAGGKGGYQVGGPGGYIIGKRGAGNGLNPNFLQRPGDIKLAPSQMISPAAQALGVFS